MSSIATVIHLQPSLLIKDANTVQNEKPDEDKCCKTCFNLFNGRF